VSGEVSSKKTASAGKPGVGKAGIPKWLTVRVPASTSNLGPGFDTLGLALQLYNTLTFELLDTHDPRIPLVRLQGEIAQGLPPDDSNLVYRVLSALWKDSPDLLNRIRITIDSQIPLSGGLGSSASATLGAVWASCVLTGKEIDYDHLLSHASSFEGHPDNVAPSLYGGFVVCARSPRLDRVLVQKLDWPDEWCTIIVAPHYSVPTQEARALLPASVPLKDAVSNIQNVSLLISAIVNKDEEALKCALEDRIHEPYRQKLIPELGELKAKLTQLPALGCVLSGAGSSILVLVSRKNKAPVLAFLKDWAAHRTIAPTVLDLKVARHGIEQLD